MSARDRIGTEVGLMTGRIKKTFRNGRDSINGMQTTIVEKTRRAARRTDYYVHDNAWTMMALCAGAALAAGFLLSRRSTVSIETENYSADPDESSSKKKNKVNSWEFIHSAIPLALFAIKALQSSRCARNEESD
jgi:ElaB/YqjD/DUF883 family membrane-anchored ribosome-binding protein